jgi:hypothetical protein
MILWTALHRFASVPSPSTNARRRRFRASFAGRSYCAIIFMAIAKSSDVFMPELYPDERIHALKTLRVENLSINAT